MRNIRIVLAYDGTDFHGWQRQPHRPTVQGRLEDTLKQVLGESVQVYGSGRTDAGVHALNQIANFRTGCRIPCANLLKALNNALPPAIRVKGAEEVSEKFHARYDARAKTYRYRICQQFVCSPFLSRFVWHYPLPLDRLRMSEAARLLEGEHDFTSFAASEDSGALEEGARKARAAAEESHPKDSATTVRRIFFSRTLWRPCTSVLIYEVKGSGFLHHMVRSFVGTLVEVGKGKIAPGDILKILEARDRTLAGPTAPPQGLCLVNVEY